uniref:Uncharacterized protein n=1 Tax=Anguilla anguilla TaxID=7936 RepID=A0A0E9P5U3_ANGAN
MLVHRGQVRTCRSKAMPPLAAVSLGLPVVVLGDLLVYLPISVSS